MSTTLISKTQQQNELGKVLTNSYFLDKKKLVRHQLDGYDNFIDTKLYEILEEYNANPKWRKETPKAPLLTGSVITSAFRLRSFNR